jgi:uncharacterized membrane protein YgaE (UPF0421/DUF939 family)
MRTQEEIKKAIEHFKKLKKTLPEYSAFGDPNHLIIDAQLDVLECKMDRDEIDELDSEEYGDMGISDITNVADWMDGENIDIVEE